MAIYHMVCHTVGCDRRGATQGRLRATSTLPCPGCGGTLMRRPQGPGTSVVQRLDNGVMPRAVERPEGMAELLDEESRAREGGGRG